MALSPQQRTVPLTDTAPSFWEAVQFRKGLLSAGLEATEPEMSAVRSYVLP